jgi:hypothetical protein
MPRTLIQLITPSILLACAPILAAKSAVPDARPLEPGTRPEPVAPTAYELGVPMMETTFKIVGGNTSGSAFVLGRPCPGSPRARFVLISAAHVLESVGDHATLAIRTKAAAGWQRGEWPVTLRQDGKTLWTKHPSADVGVMYVQLPAASTPHVITTDLLATDVALAEAELRPGDDLLVLGFPLGAEANQAGFPYARVGRVASYPLLPTATFRTFALDFRVFKGNSGGPVIWSTSARNVRGVITIGSNWIVGLVSSEILFVNDQQTPYETRHAEIQLGLANVVPAPLIREAVEMLPPVASDEGCR